MTDHCLSLTWYQCSKLVTVVMVQFTLPFFRGNTPDTKGTAFVVYEDIFDAKNACDHLSGFNVCNRYLVVLYYQSNKVSVCNRYLVVLYYQSNKVSVCNRYLVVLYYQSNKSKCL